MVNSSSRMTCGCGRPEGQHSGLSCGPSNSILTHHNREAIERVRRLAPLLMHALKSMLNTHGMHGPCKHNSCSDCNLAYQMAKAVIRKAEGG